MHRHSFLLLFFCLLGTVGHGAPRTESPPFGVSQIVVQHTQCYGKCPVNSLTLNADGSATYANF